MVRGLPGAGRDAARRDGGGFGGDGPAVAQAAGRRRRPGACEASSARRQRIRLRQSGRMTDLTSLTLAHARDRLRTREFSAAELADAHLAAMERARALNAFVLETPEQARA